jgi:signal transduction histidine kinase
MLEEGGLKSAITWYLEGFSERSGIKTCVEIPSDFGRISRDIELALFRVLQESLNNVHKHSGSDRVDIKVFKTEQTITAEVRDYGKGLSETILQQAQTQWKTALGVGLRGMTERMRQLGGELTVYAADPGVVVRASVPTSLSPHKLGS